MRSCKFIFVLLAMLLPRAAFAGGTAVILNADGTRTVYPRVTIRVLGHRAVRVTSHDGSVTLVVRNNDCRRLHGLEACRPYWAHLIRSGVHHRLDFRNGSEYFNRGGSTERLPSSSVELARNGLALSFVTRSSVKVTVNGQIDRYFR